MIPEVTGHRKEQIVRNLGEGGGCRGQRSRG